MLKFKKSLGQNLLIDKNIISKIISLSSLHKKNLLEIGPGTGNLTKEIIKKKPRSLLLIEKDKRLSLDLKKIIDNKKNIKVIYEDILKLDLERLLKEKTIILGNLPYNISTQILVKFIKFKKWLPSFDELIFMFQKEVGEKIIADFKEKNYSRLSIFTRSRLKVIKYFYVSKNSFFPRPKVDSIVILFKPILNANFKLKNINNLEYVTKVLFSGKRKMINKALRKLSINDEKTFNNLGINPSLRPEKLSENTYFKIAEFYEKKLDK